MQVRAVVVAAVVSALVPGCFELERLEALRDGDIRVEVTDENGDPVVGARAFAVGTGRVGISDDAGVVVVGPMPFGDYVVRIDLDDNDDGLADRGVYTQVLSSIINDSSSNVARVTSFDHGVVVVGDSGSVAGSLAGCDVTEICRVVAFRTVAGETLPIEGTGVVAGGVWRIDGLLAGDVELAAYAWERPLSTAPLQQLIAATRPTRVAHASGSVGDDDVVLTLEAAPASTTAAIDLRDAQADLAGTANYLVPSTTTFATVANLSGNVPGANVAIPVGVFDLTVQVDGRGGRLDGLVGVPGLSAPFVSVATGSFDCIASDGRVDCNGDDSSDVVDLNGNGEHDLGDVDLDNDGIADSEDPDVDGDGIDDDDEPTACRVAGRGADRDHDCLCDAIDPLPDCQSNDPVDCAAVVAPVCD